ncbi:3-oxoacyl-(acyl-carrier-protein) reductase protein (plasmid) [Rhizobium gallicum]|uniref:3-oxoacyl-(Acyl-carrier-protein) reductase protein n=1 Tax=Rhizobium gallicum TaxID=56730 RepID=A0A1L5NS38_9HYPH|nr:SDR family NAD(P)-dependent oxidoreductase [Rhizobium gallicum]APO70688.1 3-oxoacyl-(acyl-carrier-protein) reductase protein [Rhizobium gallicum]
MNRYDLQGRTAVVTGGASGLGLGVTRRLLDSGARVAIWGISERELADAIAELDSSGSVLPLVVDVVRYVTVAAATAATVEAFGGIDILVNSAGINRPPMDIGEASLSDWDDVIAVDLTGVFYCCRAVIPHMITNGYGRVVNVASTAGKEGNPRMVAYSAAKAGVIALTKSLGKELGDKGVIVNSIAPTVIDTPMNRKTSAADPAMMERLLAKIPLGRRGTVEEFSAMVAWMCSEDCSFSTGAVFDLSGGRTTY